MDRYLPYMDHSVGIRKQLSPDTGERTMPQPQPHRLAFDLPTPEGWKVELTLVLVLYQDGLPVWRQSHIQVVTN